MKKYLHELKKGDVFLFIRKGREYKGVFDGLSEDRKVVFYHKPKDNAVLYLRAERCYEVVDPDRNGFATCIIGAVILLLLILGVIYALSPTIDNAKMRETTHVVESGESLWSIAAMYCPGKVRTDEWIRTVKKLNELTNSTIYPGDVLTVLEEDKSNE